jgi:dTDP-4-amino-4,6-dideoxygalactose transaminase
MGTSFIPQFRVWMNKDAGVAVNSILQSGYIGQGEKVEEFEAALKDLLGFEYGVTLNSATSGLFLALKLIGVGPGDNVVSTAMTCSATNEAIVMTGADIVWADVDGTGNISPDSVEQVINEKTKAVMAIDWGGLPADYENLRFAIAKAQNRNYRYIPIVEDAAHALLAEYRNKPITQTGGDYVVYSFQAIKHLTTGDGGLLVVPSEEMYERAKLLRWYGLDRSQGDAMRCYQDITEAGYKFHMNDISATIGLANIGDAVNVVRAHRRNAQFFRSRFHGRGIVDEFPSDTKSSYWLFTIHVPNPREFQTYMEARGVRASQAHNRNDSFTCFSQYKSELPNLDKWFSTMSCIPVGWWLDEDDREIIVRSVESYLDS